MTAPLKWQENNDRKLAAMLAKLRNRLDRFAQASSSPSQSSGNRPAPASPPAPAQQATKLSQADLPSRITRSSILRLLTPSAKPVAGDIGSADKSPAADASAAPETVEGQPVSEMPSAFDHLTERLGLSPFEKNVLLLCAAMELDTRIAGLCARAQDDPHKPYPTFALALALFDEPSWEALSPERPLRYWRIIEVNQAGGQALTTSALRADERIVSYLKGLNYLDDRLLPFLVPVELEAGPATVAPSQAESVELILGRLQEAAQAGPLPV